MEIQDQWTTWFLWRIKTHQALITPLKSISAIETRMKRPTKSVPNLLNHPRRTSNLQWKSRLTSCHLPESSQWDLEVVLFLWRYKSCNDKETWKLLSPTWDLGTSIIQRKENHMKQRTSGEQHQTNLPRLANRCAPIGPLWLRLFQQSGEGLDALFLVSNRPQYVRERRSGMIIQHCFSCKFPRGNWKKIFLPAKNLNFQNFFLPHFVFRRSEERV